jgi:flagellum-specific ATP synthase
MTQYTLMPAVKKLNRVQLKDSMGAPYWDPQGKVIDVLGTIIEARLPQSRMGMVVDISYPGQNETLLAEVVGFRGDRSLLLPYSSLSGISSGAVVTGQRMFDEVPVGDFLLGKVIDPFFRNLKGDGNEFVVPPENSHKISLDASAPNPMDRDRIERVMTLGIKAMDSLLTFGEGQRIGIFAGSGVGKSVLLGMIAKGSDTDINVIGLIGERGREVREFIERDLGEKGLARSVVVCVTSDKSPLMRIRAAKLVTAIAEHFSQKGKRVILMMDSLTRVAQAQREIGLAVGEPPTSKGYPPSVYSLLPRLLERCGPQAHGRGSISGLFTVLVDGDDFNDPIPDTVRGILDGHINLSRDLASKGHFPAIEVTTSTSRVMRDIVSKEHWNLALAVRSILSIYQQNLDIIQIGAYQAGSNPQIDCAIALMPQIEAFLKQDTDSLTNLADAIGGLMRIYQTSVNFHANQSKKSKQG